MKKILLALVIVIPLSIYAQDDSNTQVDTLQLFYDIDAYLLDPAQKRILNKRFLSEDSIQSINIIAYADYLNTADYNLKLSKRRAKQVKKEIGFYYSDTKTIFSIAKGRQTGKALTETIGNSKNRRVDILITTHPSTYKKLRSKRHKYVNSTPKAISYYFEHLDVGEHFIIEDLLFKGNQHLPIDKSKSALEELLKALKEHPNIHIEIQGHVCCVDEYFDAWDELLLVPHLSETRAAYIYGYLFEHGINKERLTHKGFGASQKLYPNEKDAFEQQQNRRIEIKIKKK